MHDYDVQTTLNDLEKSFEEFKSTQDQRLHSLEAKGHSTPEQEEKLAKLEKQMDKAEHRLKTLQVAQLRPQQGSQTNENMDTAFTDYVRKGLTVDLELKTLSSGSDPDGGYLVPSGLDFRLRETLAEHSILRRLASVRQISTNVLDLLIDKDMADAGWVTETQDRPETSTSELAKIHIPVYEMYAKPRATQRLLDDANINVEEWISHKISQKMALMENQAFVSGDGDNKPRGLMDYESMNTANWSWGQWEEIRTGQEGGFLDDLGVEVLIDLFHALKPQYLSGACWLMSRTAQASIRKLKDPHSGHYLWQPALAEGSVASLLGYPVHTCDDMPALVEGHASRSVLFGNFKEAYQIADRQGTRVLRDPYSAKPYVEFYTTRRVGGDVVNFEALKVLNFAA